MRLVRLVLLSALAACSGCATLGYYAQAAGGQLDLLARARPIQEILDDTADAPASPAFKARLSGVLQLREFSVRVLGLPDNDSYRFYAELDRPAVAWNVVATPEFSLTPKEWCYPFAGCVPYRGYFSEPRARRFATGLNADGLDVRIAPVAAYSTLGWFNDPLLSSHLKYSDTLLAAVLFHELAHQQLYVADDAAFNESFATTVEIEGLRRWTQQGGNIAAFDAFLADRAKQEQFIALLRAARLRLETLYASGMETTGMRAAKAAVFTGLRADYAGLRAGWGDSPGFDSWFAQDLNNAHLAGVDLYHRYVPAFQTLLRRTGNDLPAFYRAARRIGRLPAAERAAQLAGLEHEPTATP
jgi:predicted aminopeptidase